MAINFQVMTENQKNEYGKYVPDWEALKAGASCEEEKEYIEKIIAQDERWKSKGRGEFVGFAFNMVYITKQSCGHFEIFQDQLAAKGITKEMLNMDNFAGLTARELQNIVDSARLKKKGTTAGEPATA